MSWHQRERIITAPFFAQGISIEQLNDRRWDLVPRVEITHHWSGAPAHIDRHASAQVCWTNEALNVRFVCTQREPLVVTSNPVTREKTIGLWDRDVCEIFIAPEPQNPCRYFEFEASPSGEWIDLGILITETGKQTDWDYDSGMITAAELDDEHVTIGIRIPWSESIPKPSVGDKWKANLFRCVGPESHARYLAWQPTKTREPNFHVPEAFGWLRFL